MCLGTFEEVTILFSDIVTFTIISSKCKPEEVLEMLNDLFTLFDHLTVENDVYKVKLFLDEQGTETDSRME